MMTKKDFEAIAGAINTRVHYLKRNTAANVNAIAAIRGIASDIARHCTDSNPRFDGEKFMDACGLRNVAKG